MVDLELLHAGVPLILLVSDGVHLLGLPDGLSDLVVHALIFLLEYPDSVFDQLSLVIHGLSLV